MHANDASNCRVKTKHYKICNKHLIYVKEARVPWMLRSLAKDGWLWEAHPSLVGNQFPLYDLHWEVWQCEQSTLHLEIMLDNTVNTYTGSKDYRIEVDCETRLPCCRYYEYCWCKIPRIFRYIKGVWDCVLLQTMHPCSTYRGLTKVVCGRKLKHQSQLVRTQGLLHLFLCTTIDEKQPCQQKVLYTWQCHVPKLVMSYISCINVEDKILIAY